MTLCAHYSMAFANFQTNFPRLDHRSDAARAGFLNDLSREPMPLEKLDQIEPGIVPLPCHLIQPFQPGFDHAPRLERPVWHNQKLSVRLQDAVYFAQSRRLKNEIGWKRADDRCKRAGRIGKLLRQSACQPGW